MPPVKREQHVRYPYPSYNFQLYVTGKVDDKQSVSAAFSEVSGLQVEVKVIEYRDGSDEPFLRKGRGLSSYQNLTFKRGVTGHMEFWKWILQGMNRNVDRSPGGVVLLNEDRDAVMTWTFEDAWPTKYIGPTFNAKNNEIAMETLEIAVEQLRIDL
jgi:phage tail-like protein